VKREAFEHVVRAAAAIVDCGYYAHGVGPETPQAPAGWQERLVRVALAAARATAAGYCLCMEIHDLVLANSQRDDPTTWSSRPRRFGGRLVDREQLVLGIELMPKTRRGVTARRLKGLLARLDRLGRG
jgi:hypothetical protein